MLRLDPAWLRRGGQLWTHCTRGFSSSVPPQPVPPLEQTLSRYLRALEPHLPPSEWQQARAELQEFSRQGGAGEGLQRSLERRAQRMHNWVSEWWQQSNYLESRLPLAVHSNPAVALPQQDYSDWRGQLLFAAKLIAGVLDFKAKIDSHALLVEYMRGRPLCMEQYSQVFSSCRVPGPKHDHVLLYNRIRRPPTHITVVRNFQFFQLEVYNSDGSPLTVGQIHSQLQRIRAQSWKTDKEPMGILTSQHRNTWGQAYNRLLRDRINRDSVRAIERALFGVCLDAPVMRVSEGRYSSRMAAQVLHGGGTYSNSGNRWFDKTLQFIVGEDGSCGVLYEQAIAEGPPIATIVDHVLEYTKQPETVRAPMVPLPHPKKLYFYIDPEIKRDIELAKQNLDSLINDLDISCFTFRKFGKNFPKKHRLSPNSLIQTALQLAYYRMYGELAVTCESVSLRMFRGGRTDTVRCATPEALRFAQAADDPCVMREMKVALLKEAVEAHSILTEQALQGQAIDRHLLGLKLQAIEDGRTVPTLFMDTAYAIATHWRLRTGQVASRTDSVMCFGPLEPDGYAVCYNPMSEHINFSVSAFNCCEQTHAERLAQEIRRALGHLQELLQPSHTA
ncbi:carnitine O-acetyltransferase b [Amia ocellicauda]|uniref:carnitine O-acetyltransferase b n=1 Tax=Amia ocellicauda TaxID=2972642 RepID=UPI0034640E7D